MSDFMTLSCPTCGGRLEITPDIDRFACSHCGHEHIVRRAGGLVSLKPVMERLETIESGTERTASELAIRRLTPEVEALERQLAELASPSSIGLLGVGTMSFIAVGVGFMCLLTSLILLTGGESQVGLLTLILAIGFVAAGAGYGYAKMNSARRTREQRDRLSRELAAEMSELARHRQVVGYHQ